jgi:hypothetical protein
MKRYRNTQVARAIETAKQAGLDPFACIDAQRSHFAGIDFFHIPPWPQVSD